MGLMKKHFIDERMNHIAGRSHGRAAYTDNTSGESPVATHIEQLLRDIDTSVLSHAQIDHLERVLSAGLSGLQLETLSRFGIKIRRWNPRKGQPGVTTNGLMALRGWNDHPSVRVHKKGTIEYVTEPYGIDDDALRDLVNVADQGWDIRIDTYYSSHFPGRTIGIFFTKKEKKK
jgi:hypothetical protein